MSVKRMSFAETPEWKDSIGFIVRAGLQFDPLTGNVFLRRGSLVYGFKNENQPAHGFIFENDIQINLPNQNQTCYVLADSLGTITAVTGDFNRLRGIGANIPGVPWYAFNERALIGKIFQIGGLVTGCMSCDDAFWCEFEGVF